MRYILGLDISTSVVGYTIIDETGKLHEMSYIKLSSMDKDDLYAKATAVGDVLEKYRDIVTDISIEEPLVMFRAGASRAQILSKLSMFNGMVGILSKTIYNTTPVLYNVNNARKTAFPLLKFPRGEDRKELVMLRIAEHWPDVDWPVMAKGKNIGKPRKECFDMADSAIISLAHLKRLRDSGEIVQRPPY